jgi:hypothetical protein
MGSVPLHGVKGAKISLKRTLIALSLLTICLVPATPSPAGSKVLPKRPNIVVIMLDDMRFDQLHDMPTVMSQLVGKGRRSDEPVLQVQQWTLGQEGRRR